MKRKPSHAVAGYLHHAVVISLYFHMIGTLLSQPNVYDRKGLQSTAANSLKSIRMAEMAWPDIQSAIEQGYTTVVVAVGSMEQHGPQLPTMTDTRIGDALAHRVAVKLGRTLHASAITVGCSSHHFGFPGTLSLREETLGMILLDYIDSLIRSGFKRIVFIPMHGGNFPTVQKTLKEAQIAHRGIEIIGVTNGAGLSACLIAGSAEFGISASESGEHAGESETSIMMALETNLVPTERLTPGYVGTIGEKEVKMLRALGMQTLTKNGVLGDPRKASADKGEVYLNHLTEFVIQEIKRQSRAVE